MGAARGTCGEAHCDEFEFSQSLCVLVEGESESESGR